MALLKYKRYDLRDVRSGEPFSLSFLAPEGLDLTGFGAQCQVRRYPTDVRVAVEMEVDIDGRYIHISKPAAGMRLAPGQYHYDVRLIELYDPVAFESVTGGKLCVIQSVTR